jgi:predicted metal-dependent hydrolase
MPKITLGTQKIAYTVQESERARRVRLKISAKHGLQVIIPAGAKFANLDEFIENNADWILKHYNRLQQEAQEQVPQRRFVSGEILPLLGESHRMDVEAKPRGKLTTVMVKNDTIQVRLGKGYTAEHHTEIRSALESWYRDLAKDYIVRRVEQLARQHGFEYKRITIKSQSTRWGSCSSKHNLNFNWRLIMAPPAAIDYVIIHELCHLRELNHSARFWRLVAQYCPNYETWVKWFKHNSAALTW